MHPCIVAGRKCVKDTMVLESMKMEIPVEAPRPGRVARILVAEAADVVEGQVLAVLDT